MFELCTGGEMKQVIWFVRAAAIVLAGAMFFGFAWWSRPNIGLAATLFILAPAVTLALIGLLPMRLFAYVPFRVGLSALVVISATRLGLDIVSAASLPVAADRAAIVFHSAALTIIGVWVWMIWGKKRTASNGAQPF